MEGRALEDRRGYLVVKDNDLIQKAKYNLTAAEQKLICYVISLIKPDDTELKEYTISVSDYCELLGIDRNRAYSDIASMVDALDEKRIIMDNEYEHYPLRWFSEAVYQKKAGKLKVRLHTKMQRYLIGLSEKFTQYELYNILLLKSKYSLALYELCKSFAYRKMIDFETEDLKERLGAEKYKNWNHFARRCLDVAVDEINKFTDISIQYTTIKTGRKVTGIRFRIDKKDMTDRYMTYRQVIDKINRKNHQSEGQLSIFDLDEREFKAVESIKKGMDSL